MYIEFDYYRIPDFWFVRQNKKGKPRPALLYEYRNGCGFSDLPRNVKPYPKGGKVVCYLVDENWLTAGMSTCSMSDTFSYKTGKEIALLRAINLGLGHELDSGLMFRLDDWENKSDDDKFLLLIHYVNEHKNRLNFYPNTFYFHPETAKTVSEWIGFNVKTSKIILKNHVWMGFEAE